MKRKATITKVTSPAGAAVLTFFHSRTRGCYFILAQLKRARSNKEEFLIPLAVTFIYSGKFLISLHFIY